MLKRRESCEESLALDLSGRISSNWMCSAFLVTICSYFTLVAFDVLSENLQKYLFEPVIAG